MICSALKYLPVGPNELGPDMQRREGGDFSPLDKQVIRQSQTRGVQADVAAAEAFRSTQS